MIRPCQVTIYNHFIFSRNINEFLVVIGYRVSVWYIHRYKEEDSLHWTMHPDDLASFRGPSRDQGLMSFLDENVEVAMERTRTAAPIIDEVSQF